MLIYLYKVTGVIQPLNEQEGIKSTTSVFIGECYVPSKSIGLLQKGQIVSLQIDLFDYHYFGLVTGSVYSIDDDYILIEKRACFQGDVPDQKQNTKVIQRIQLRIKKWNEFSCKDHCLQKIPLAITLW